VPLVIIWLALMIGAFYLLLWRPQQRRMAMVRALQSTLRQGDEVLTEHDESFDASGEASEAG